MKSIYNDFVTWFVSLSKVVRFGIICLVLILFSKATCSDEEQVTKAPKPVKESSEVIMLRKIDAVLERTDQNMDSLDVSAIFTGHGSVEIVSNNHKTLTNVVVALNINYYYFLEEMLPGVEYSISASKFLHKPDVYYDRKTMRNLWFNVVCDQGIESGRWSDNTDTHAPEMLPPRE